MRTVSRRTFVGTAIARSVAVRGGAVRSVRATTLTSRDVHDHDTFEAPRAVVPAESDVAAGGAVFAHRFPAASVTKLGMGL